MTSTGKIKQIEKVLGTATDGVWGDDDKKALGLLTKSTAAPPQQQATAPPPGVQPIAPPGPEEAPMTYK